MTGRIFQGDLNRMHISKNQTRYMIDVIDYVIDYRRDRYDQ